MSPTAVTPTSLISGTVSTNRSSSNEKAKANDERNDSCDENRKISNINNQKRNRTTILHEQQDYLMSKYSSKFNLLGKILEDVSSSVKLEKCVVQVWFESVQAKEKKKTNFFTSGLPGEYQPNNDQCNLCQIKYILQTSQRIIYLHQKYIENIRSILSK